MNTPMSRPKATPARGALCGELVSPETSRMPLTISTTPSTESEFAGSCRSTVAATNESSGPVPRAIG